MNDSRNIVTLYSEVKPSRINWIWYPYIAIGKITLLQGDPGEGKSTMMLQVISEVSKGGSFPDGQRAGMPQKVIYQCSEDGAGDTIKPRLEACGADCSRVAFINEEKNEGLTLDDERLRQAIASFRPKLVVIDPIQAYIENDADLQIAVRARRIMRHLSMWATVYNCAIVLIGHMNKREGAKSLYRGLGSIDVVAAARSILQVERDSTNENERIVKQIKSSLAPRGNDIRFSIEPDKGFIWLRQVENTKDLEEAEMLLEMPKTKHELAAYLLKQLLKDGPVESKMIMQTLSQYRIGDKTIQETKTEMGIKSQRKMRRWYWYLDMAAEEK